MIIKNNYAKQDSGSKGVESFSCLSYVGLVAWVTCLLGGSRIAFLK